MKLFPLFLTFVFSWDYLLFVQVWPGSWITTTYPFNNTYFTVHGLWPEYNNSTWPQFCTKERFNFTAIQNISQELSIFWTDFKNPKNLWQHEFQKHATCAELDPLLSSEYQYFSTGLSLRQKYDTYNLLKNNSIIPSNTIKYKTDTISNIFLPRVAVICDKNNILNEIRFCLDKNLIQFDCPNSEMKAECQNDYIIYNLVI